MSQSASAFLDEQPSAEDFLNTPTGLPSINKSTDTLPPPQVGAGQFENPSSTATANVSPGVASFDPAGALSVAREKLTPSPAVAGALLMGAAAAPETAGLSMIPALGTAAAAGGLGAMGGEAYHQLGQHFSNFMANLPFGSNGAPLSSEEAATKLGEAGEVGAVQGAGGELMSRAIAPITSKFTGNILAPLDKYTSPVGQTVEEALSAQKEFGIPQTPAQTTNAPILKWLENKLRNNPKTSAPLIKFDIEQLKAKIAARDTLLEQGDATARLEDIGLSIQNDLNRMIQKTELSLHPDVQAIKDTVLQTLGSKESSLQLGLDSQAAVKSFLDTKQAMKNVGYDTLSAQMPPDVKTVPTNFIKALQDSKAELMQGSAALREEAGTQNQINVIDNLLSSHNQYPPEIQAQIDQVVGQLGPGVSDAEKAALTQKVVQQLTGDNAPSPLIRTYAQMNEDSKLLNAASTDSYGKEGSRVSVIYQKLRQALRSDMKDLAASTGNPDLYDKQVAVDALNTDWKNAQANKNLQVIMKSKPTAVADIVFNPGNDAMILDMKKNFPELYPRLQKKATDSLFDSAGKDLTGNTIRQNLANFGPTADTIWDAEAKSNILRAADTIDGRIDFGQAISKNPVFKSAVEANPTMVADKFVNKERIGPIVLAKRLLSKETNEKISSAFLRKTLVSDGVGSFDPMQSMETFNKYGREVYSELYGSEKAAQLERFLKLASNVDTEALIKKVPARGQMSNSLLGFSAILYGMIKHPLVTAAGLASSWAVAPLITKNYLTPFVADWMTKGIESPAALKAAIPVVNMVAGRTAAALATYVQQTMKNSEDEE